MTQHIDWLVALWSSSLWRASLHGTVAIMLGLTAERLWRGFPAAWRSWMWRLIFVRIAIVLLQPMTIPLPLLPAPSEVLSEEIQTSEFVSRTRSNQPQVTEPTATFSWPAGLAIVWIIGVSASGALIWQRARYARQQVLGSRALIDPIIHDQIRQLTGRLRPTAEPDVRVVEGMGSPCLIGGIRSVMLLPNQWLAICSPAQLRLAVAHELAHLTRHDLRWNKLIAVCRVVLFFHPLVWVATRRYQASQELACDELALRQADGSPTEFARLLLQFAEQPVSALAGGARMTGTTSTLHERIVAMTRPIASSLTLPTTLAAIAVVIACMAPLSLAEQKPRKVPHPKPPAAANKAPETVTEQLSVEASSTSSSETSDAANATQAGGSSNKAIGTGTTTTGGISGVLGNGIASGLVGGSSSSSTSGSASTQAAGSATGSATGSGTGSITVSGERITGNMQPSSNRRSQQMRSSTGAGGTTKWSRITETSDDDEEIRIEEDADQIRMIFKNNSTNSERRIVVKNVAQLEKKYPDAAATYHSLTGGTAGKNVADKLGQPTPDAAQKAKQMQLEQLKEQVELLRKQEQANRAAQSIIEQLDLQIQELEQQTRKPESR